MDKVSAGKINLEKIVNQIEVWVINIAFKNFLINKDIRCIIVNYFNITLSLIGTYRKFQKDDTVKYAYNYIQKNASCFLSMHVNKTKTL